MTGVEKQGRVFRARRLTGAARLEVLRAWEKVQEAIDVVVGLQQEMAHTARRLDALRDAEEFDRGERDAVIQARAQIRGDLTAAQDRYHTARLRLVIAQTENPPDVEWCMEHLTADDVDEILGETDEEGDDQDPPPDPSPQSAEPSS